MRLAATLRQWTRLYGGCHLLLGAVVCSLLAACSSSPPGGVKVVDRNGSAPALRGVRRSPAGSTSCAAATPCIPLPSASAGTGKPWPRAMASRRPIPSRSVKLSNLVGGHRRNRPSRKTRRSSLRPWRPSLPRFHPQLVRRYLPSPHRLRPRPRPHPAAARLPSSRGLRWGWAWPASGTLIGRFASNGSLNKGIDIAGQLGQPVLAASGGTVVYAGSGLRGYGELVIIKHNETYVSAYGHNRRLLVREGQQVKVGQSIAEMGSTGTDRVKLHFEIRRQGKPVDPLQYLPRR